MCPRVRKEVSMQWFDVREKTQFQESKLSKVNLCESARMFCDVYGLEPGQEQRLHSHDDADKVYIALTGRPTVIMGAEHRFLTPLEGAWAPAGAPQGVRNRSGERVARRVFQAGTAR